MNNRPDAKPHSVACGDCPIRHRAVCSRAEPDELKLLESAKYYRSYEAGQTIVWAGDRMDFVASVVSGVATLTQSMEDGRTQMVGLLLPSEFLGRPGRDIAPFTATATTDVLMCCFRRKSFEDIVQSIPNVGQRLLEMTLDELDAAQAWMLVLGRKTAREKLATLLANVARRRAVAGAVAAAKDVQFDLPLTREAMADYLGLTLETVSRQFSALRKSGVISLQGARAVTVPDIHRLMAESGGDDAAEQVA